MEALRVPYTGHFTTDGRFIPDNPRARMPVDRLAVVTFPDKDMAGGEDNHQKRVAVIGKILDEALGAEDIALTDDEWEEMANLRAVTNAGLSRKIIL